MGFLRLLRPWGFSHEARRGPQGASRAAPGKSGLHAHGEGELVLTLESWEMARSSRVAKCLHNHIFPKNDGVLFDYWVLFD